MHTYDKLVEPKTSALQRLLTLANEPGWISFGGGLPDVNTLFLGTRFEELINRVVANEQVGLALQYPPTAGVAKARQIIADKLLPGISIKASPGAKSTIDDIILTAGGQKVLYGMAANIVDKSKVIVTESPTYLGGVSAFLANGINCVPIENQPDGMNLQQLEQVIKEKKPENISFIYVIPDFQNPMGNTWSVEKRTELVNIARKYNVEILEDSPYPMMYAPGGSMQPSVKSIEQKIISEKGGKPHVIYVGSSSKIFGPGLRTAWMIAPPYITQGMVGHIGVADLTTNAIGPVLIFNYLEEHGFDGLMDDTESGRHTYAAKRKKMADELKAVFGDNMKYDIPSGGMFFWVNVPGVKTGKMQDWGIDFIKDYDAGKYKENHEVLKAMSELNAEGKPNPDDIKIAYVPGEAFNPTQDGTYSNHMRLSYSQPTEEQITVGVKRLKNLITLYQKLGGHNGNSV